MSFLVNAEKSGRSASRHFRPLQTFTQGGFVIVQWLCKDLTDEVDPGCVKVSHDSSTDT